VRAGVLALALALACAPDLPPPSQIEKLRLLAVRSEPPETPPGVDVALDVLVAAPRPCGDFAPTGSQPMAPSVDALWFACPAAGRAGEPTPASGCAARLQAGDPASLLVGAGPSVNYRVAEGASEILVGVVVAELELGASACLTDLAATGAPTRDRCVLGIKRITATSRPSNRNPSITGLELDVLPVAGARVGVTPRFEDDDTDLTFAWFVTAGEMDHGRSEAAHPGNQWIAPPAACTTDLHVVIRDGRGGTAWLSTTLTVPSGRSPRRPGRP
jgi:hypothetical protein